MDAYHHRPRSTMLPCLIQSLKEQLDMLEAWKNSTRGERQMKAAAAHKFLLLV